MSARGAVILLAALRIICLDRMKYMISDGQHCLLSVSVELYINQVGLSLAPSPLRYHTALALEVILVRPGGMVLLVPVANIAKVAERNQNLDLKPSHV